ncbi:hypothetical protein Kpol_380p10 [Vanderwaltozyma polyspora DSM 70294]|uniref:Uncharacterized protein n=1 Tax=Vanderwaltozyma polyspora (strain ATCC 22028 / DSM 70294 / BCRC 21397 / CBS 2163 / NBRC 10782 / NRRL Y-8283 / UCD 57-17) TaxID=436907 RepID=A7TS69_VANPO|nr:uncharacterized protein Kpol_380p10 [Vanderwaltozyma polyspora DSM 70294]EDO14891.1 hypothetical protein Kpol_380p10 [Vanderwaltozyma polyspora DSM 70294]
MRQTTIRFAKAYTPMIKFVGTKHPILQHEAGVVMAHPCTMDGLIPGSKDCTSVSEYLSKLRPFVVVPYNNPNKGNIKAGAKFTGTKFTDRPLMAGEVSAISELPARFRFKPMDEAELDSINGGGAI